MQLLSELAVCFILACIDRIRDTLSL